ncbi:MAG: 3-oxoacyl-ACP reductase, partial [Actinobacteria bacterium 13_1_20CM_3_71_11]
MSDPLGSFASSGPGRALLRRLGLPNPPRLRRFSAGDPLVPGPVLVGGDGQLAKALHAVLTSIGVDLRDPGEPGPNAALIFDATGIGDSSGLRQLYDFFHPHTRGLYPSGRVIVVGTRPDECVTAREAAAQRALRGFVRSTGKELGRGSTANLVYASPDGDLESTLRFLLSAKSAYVSGQVICIGPAANSATINWDKPLTDMVALVTGAARGIGAAIAATLARDGAHVVCLDLPSSAEPLAKVAQEVAGTPYQLDITDAEAPTRMAEHLEAHHGGVDIVVHNAGVNRDRMLSRMSPHQWDEVLRVNLLSQELINDELLTANLIPEGGRIISVASVAGIAGSRSQANYATSKAGVIGLVESMAGELASRGITINGVAPGFIESSTTARLPLFLREFGRRMNSMSQGGLPIDVAETVAY